MSDYPKTIPEVSAAIETYVFDPDWALDEGEQARLEADLLKFSKGQIARSPVVRIMAAFESLRPWADRLDDTGLTVLAGAAHMIAENGFGQSSGLPPIAFGVRDQVRDRLTSGVP